MHRKTFQLGQKWGHRLHGIVYVAEILNKHELRVLDAAGSDHRIRDRDLFDSILLETTPVDYASDSATLLYGDFFQRIADAPVFDLGLIGPPYASTGLSWDVDLRPDLDRMWLALATKCKVGTVLVFQTKQPLTSYLTASAPKDFRWWSCLTWEKPNAPDSSTSRYRQINENLVIFCYRTDKVAWHPPHPQGNPYDLFEDKTASVGNSVGGGKQHSLHYGSDGTRYPCNRVYCAPDRSSLPHHHHGASSTTPPHPLL